MRARKIQAIADDESDETPGFAGADGITMECICPRCGTAHRLKLLWAGRGRPKKFCQPCKAYIATLETVELHGMPAAISAGGER
jgi:hypothetical protein